MISLHAEVPGNENIFDLHEIIDETEYEISERFGCHVTIHMDPVDVTNPELDTLKAYIKKVAAKIDEKLTFHDLRIVPGQGHTNVIFDIVRPNDCSLSEEDLKLVFRKAIFDYNKVYFAVINIDNPYV